MGSGGIAAYWSRAQIPHKAVRLAPGLDGPRPYADARGDFSQATYVATTSLDRKRIDDAHPDIVIDEIVERGMVRIAKDPFP
jgi:hypothetical protein